MMKKYCKSLLPSILFVLSACGTTSTTDFGIRVEESVAFQFADIRLPDDRKSFKQSGPEGETTVLGDDAITPRPAELVRTWLHNELGSKLAGKNVQLTKFRIEILDPVVNVNDEALSASTAGMPGTAGLLGALLARPLISATESSRASKTVSVITAITIDGLEVSNNFSTTYKGLVSENNVNEAVREGLRRLTSKALVADSQS